MRTSRNYDVITLVSLRRTNEFSVRSDDLLDDVCERYNLSEMTRQDCDHEGRHVVRNTGAGHLARVEAADDPSASASPLTQKQ